MKNVIVINVKITNLDDDFSTLCVLNASQSMKKYNETLAKQISEFCDDFNITITKEQVKEIVNTLSKVDYLETLGGELVFTKDSYPFL